MIVQKFSGTALATPARINEGVVPQVIKQKQEGNSPVVVASAIGGTTDSILAAAQHSVADRYDTNAEPAVTDIRRQHLQIIQDIIKDQKLRTETLDIISDPLVRLNEIVHGIAHIGEVTDSVRDKLLAIGENLSTAILTGAIKQAGHHATAVNLDDILHDHGHFKNGETSKFHAALRDRISAVPEGSIPVVTGFFGRINQGILNAIGRGYSDYTATSIGAALSADKVEKWTDTSGILSNGKEATSISFEEASELSHGGLRVIHPFSIAPAQLAEIPIELRNILDPDSGIIRITKLSQSGERNTPFFTTKKGVTTVSVTTPFMLGQTGYLEQAASIFSSHGVNIDLVLTSAVCINFTVGHKPEKLEELAQDLGKLGGSKVEVVNSRSTISLVGCSTLFIGKALVALAEKEITVHEHSKNCIIVDDTDLETATQVLNHIS